MLAIQRIVLLCVAVLWAPPAILAGGLHEKGDTPAVISHGQKVTLADYVVPGRTTVFEFYSENCPTCRSIAPGLQKLHSTHSDVAVVKVDINRPGAKGIDWGSPVSKQYDLPSTPQIKVYGPNGKLVAEGPAAYKLVTGWFD